MINKTSWRFIGGFLVFLTLSFGIFVMTGLLAREHAPIAKPLPDTLRIDN